MIFSSLAGDDWSICVQNKKAPTVQGLKMIYMANHLILSYLYCLYGISPVTSPIMVLI